MRYKPTPSSASLKRVVDLVGKLDVRLQVDEVAVLRPRGQIAEPAEFDGDFRLANFLQSILGDLLFAGIDDDGAVRVPSMMTVSPVLTRPEMSPMPTIAGMPMPCATMACEVLVVLAR